MHFSSPGLCQVWAGLAVFFIESWWKHSTMKLIPPQKQPHVWIWSHFSGRYPDVEVCSVNAKEPFKCSQFRQKGKMIVTPAADNPEISRWIVELGAMPLHHHANLRQGDLADTRRMFLSSAFVCFGGENSGNNQRLWKAFSPATKFTLSVQLPEN